MAGSPAVPALPLSTFLVGESTLPARTRSAAGEIADAAEVDAGPGELVEWAPPEEEEDGEEEEGFAAGGTFPGAARAPGAAAPIKAPLKRRVETKPTARTRAILRERAIRWPNPLGRDPESEPSVRSRWNRDPGGRKVAPAGGACEPCEPCEPVSRVKSGWHCEVPGASGSPLA